MTNSKICLSNLPIILCDECGEEFSYKRYKLGYTVCLKCGETQARKRKHTIVPMHKSNYVLVTNKEELKSLTKVSPIRY